MRSSFTSAPVSRSFLEIVGVIGFVDEDDRHGNQLVDLVAFQHGHRRLCDDLADLDRVLGYRGLEGGIAFGDFLQALAAGVEADDADLVLPPGGDGGLQRAKRHRIVHREDPNDVGVSLQEILGDCLGLFSFGLAALARDDLNAGGDLRELRGEPLLAVDNRDDRHPADRPSSSPRSRRPGGCPRRYERPGPRLW